MSRPSTNEAKGSGRAGSAPKGSSQPWGKGSKIAHPRDWTLGDAAATAASALALAIQAKKLLNVEEKIFDNNGSAVALTAGGSVLTGLVATQLSAVAQGAQANQRNGDSIKLTKIAFAGSFQSGSAGVSANGRILIVRDNMGDGGAAPTLGQVLAFPTAPPAISSMLAANTAVTNERFTVLFDEVFSFPTTASGNAMPPPFAWSKSVKFHQDFLTGTTLGRNSIWLFTLSDAVGANGQPLFSYQWRQFYVDN